MPSVPSSAVVVRSDGVQPSSSAANVDYVSPPRQWPACFKESPLKPFLSKVLKGTRCRLTDEPPSAVLSESFEVKVDPTDSMVTAQRVHNELGWVVVKGYALFEVSRAEAAATVFEAKPHWWNEHPASKMWVDLTPRAEGHAKMVLVESAVDAAEAASVAAARAKKQLVAPPSDGAAAATPEVGSPTPAYVEPPAAAACAIGPPTKPPVAGAVAGAGAGAGADPTPLKRGGPRAHPLAGLWRSQDAPRMVPYGEKKFDGYQPTKKLLFPGRNADVRMEMHDDCTFELEARRWGRGFDGKREGAGEFAPRRDPELFAPLEYGDCDACALRVTGVWNVTQFHEVHFLVKSVDEVSNGGPPGGSAPTPPITKKDIQYAAGVSLGRPIKAPTDDATHRSSMNLILNEYLKHHCVLVRED